MSDENDPKAREGGTAAALFCGRDATYDRLLMNEPLGVPTSRFPQLG